MSARLESKRNAQRAGWFALRTFAIRADEQENDNGGQTVPFMDTITAVCAAMFCDCYTHCQEYLHRHARRPGQSWYDYVNQFQTAVCERISTKSGGADAAKNCAPSADEIWQAHESVRMFLEQTARAFHGGEFKAKFPPPPPPPPQTDAISHTKHAHANTGMLFVLGVAIVAALVGTWFVLRARDTVSS